MPRDIPRLNPKKEIAMSPVPSHSRCRLIAKLAAVAVVGSIAADALAHGTIVDSRVYLVRKAGANANLMGAWTDAMYDWAANSRNFADYAAPGFAYSNYIADGTISSAGQNNGTNGHLDFSKVNTPGLWPTTAVNAGTSFAQKWVAPAPHDPSYFDVWITNQGFDPASESMGWDDLTKLGRWEKNTALNVVATPNGALSPADNGALLSYDWTVPIPSNFSGRHSLVVVWQRRDPVGEAFFSTQDIMIAPAGPSWTATGGGNYFTSTNWSGGSVPNAATAIANFGSSITAVSTVTLNSSATLGTIRFDSANSYSLSGTGTIMLDGHDHANNIEDPGKIEVARGSHSINAGVMFHGAAGIDVASGAELQLGGPLFFAASQSVTKRGPGTLRIDSTSVTGASNAMLVVENGTLVANSPLSPSVGLHVSGTNSEAQINASMAFSALTTANGGDIKLSSQGNVTRVLKTRSFGLGGNSKLDIGDGVLVVDYDTTSPIAAVTAGIQSGVNNTAGGQLISNLADSRHTVGVVEASTLSHGGTYFGTSIDNTAVIARYTLKGDANLSGNVNFDDLLKLAQRYNQAGKWSDGDSNYDGTVNFDDLLSLAQNYGGALAVEGTTLSNDIGGSFSADFALAVSLTPEPATLSSLAVAAALLRRRRLVVGR